VIGTIAVAFGAINIVGGFLVTDRMLGMFAKKRNPRPMPKRATVKAAREMTTLAVLSPGGDVATALYIISFSLFISA